MEIYFIGIYLYQNNKLKIINKIYNMYNISIFTKYSFYKFINNYTRNNIQSCNKNKYFRIIEYWDNKKFLFNIFNYNNIYYCIITNIISQTYYSEIYQNQQKIINILFDSINNEYLKNCINLNKYIIK